MREPLVLLMAVVGVGGACNIGGSWGYLSPGAFNHTINDRGE